MKKHIYNLTTKLVLSALGFSSLSTTAFSLDQRCQLISEKNIVKYNQDFMRAYRFENLQAVENTRQRYASFNISDVVDQMLLLLPGSKNRAFALSYPELIKFNDAGDFYITPSPAYLPGNGLENHTKASDNQKGFGLGGWFIHPSLLENSYFESPQVRQNPALARDLMIHDRIAIRDVSDRPISEIAAESGKKYFASILDLSPEDLDWLKDIKKTAMDHLIDQYGFREGKDHVKMYFHFPYPTETTTLHLHIRVNQAVHPMEGMMRFELDDLIAHFETGAGIGDFILKRQSATPEKGILSTEAPQKDLSGVKGLDIVTVPNNYKLSCER